MLLAAIMLILSAMPAYAFVIVMGEHYYGEDFVLQDGAIQYIAAEKKLILNGANIEYTMSYPISSSNGDIQEIELIGENTITVNGSNHYGLEFSGADVRICGSGSLKSTANYTPLQIKYGSLTIDGASIEIAQTNETSKGVQADGDIILTDGAQLKINKENPKNNDRPAIEAENGAIEISGDSRLIIDTYQNRAFYGGILDAEYTKLSDTSGIEIVSPVDSRPDQDAYAASEVYLVNGKSENRNIFYIDRYTSAKNNWFTVTQTAEADGRYKLVIQGEEVDVPVEVPETGDHANLPLYAAMLLLSIGMLICMKKRKNA